MEKRLYFSPLGEIILAARGGALIGLWFKGQKYEQAGLDKLPSQPGTEADLTVLDKTVCWLDRYFTGRAPAVDIPLAPQGTDFQKRVWAALQAIPYGETTTYGQLAAQVGCRSARAVGAAVGRNPISVLIPCHRLVGADGSLTGYAGGLERKKALLKLEES